MSEQPPTPPQPSPMGYAPPPADLPKGLAIASMVLGIVSLVLFCIWYVSLPCAILAVILGISARKQADAGQAGGKGMATAGLIMGIIALVIVVLILILAAVGVAILGSEGVQQAMEDAARQMEQDMQEMQNEAETAPTSMLEPLWISAKVLLA